MGVVVGSSGVSNELWSAALAALERKYSKPIFEMWLKPMRPVSMSETEIVLSVQSPFARDWVENRLRGDISEVLTELLGATLALRFVVAADAPSGPPQEADMPPQAAHRAPLAEDLRHGNLNPRYTFEEFVVGNSNRFAHAASQAVAEAPARAYNPLFLYGGVGLGKTHLMHAIGHRVVAADPSANVVYVSSEKFTNEFIIAIKNNQTVEFRNKYRGVDLLLIDDFALQPLDMLETADIYEICVERHHSKSTVLTSNRDPSEWLAALADPLLAQSAVDRRKSAAWELVIEGESYRHTRSRPWARSRPTPQLEAPEAADLTASPASRDHHVGRLKWARGGPVYLATGWSLKAGK